MKQKTIRRHRVVVILTLIFTTCAILATVWLIGAGYAEAALETVIRWGEDGTMDAVEGWVIGELLPMLARIAGGAGALLAVLLPLLKKLKEAKQKLDEGTAEAVATYGERRKMQEEMQTFMGEQTAAMESLRAEQRVLQAEQRAALAAMQEEQRASLASDRAAAKRIEGKVDGLRRMEEVAHGANSELVRKGAAAQIAEIRKETEGTETEGGEAHEVDGDDGEAAEDA